MQDLKLSQWAAWLVLSLAASACGSSATDEGLNGGAGGKSSGGAAGQGSGGTASGGAAGSASGGTNAGGAAGSGAATSGGGGSAAGGTGGTGSGGAGSGGCGGGNGGTCGNDGTAWPANAQGFECQFIDLLNQKRAAGATCGTTAAPPVAALPRNQILTNNARAHSESMATNKYVDLMEPGGVGPGDWAQKGYCGTYVAAEVGGGQSNPSLFLATLMNVETECKKLMSEYGKGVGVGYVTDSTGISVHMWTLIIGSAP